MNAPATRIDRALGRAILAAAAAATVVAIVLPIVMVLLAALQTGTPGSPDAGWSLGNLATVYLSPLIVRPLLNTLLTCVPGTAIALALGVGLAWLVHRTDAPGHRWLEPLLLTPIYFSPLSLAVGWVVLAAPRIGLINILWPWPGSIVNAYSLTTIILFIGLYFTPYVYLVIAGALRGLDAGYEDAAAILGARPLRILRTVTLPMLRPQILAAGLLVFILSTSMFAEPALFGARWNFVNLPLAVYSAMLNIPANFNLAAAIGTVMALGAGAGLLLYRWALASGERFMTTQSRGFTVRRVALGPLRPLAALVAGAYLLAVVALPVIALLLTSGLRFLSPRPSWDLLTLQHWQRAFRNPAVTDAILNTLLLSTGVATITTAFGLLVAYNVVRREVRGAALADAATILPIGVPAIVLSLGFLWAYLWLPIGLYGTIWALMIALSTVIIPSTVRTLDAALRQLGGEVEFAARLLGAGTARRLALIVVPMLRSALASAWLFAFMLTTIQVSVPIILRSPGQEVLSVTVWTLVTNSGNLGEGSVVALVQGVLAGLIVVVAGRVGRDRRAA